MHKLKEKFMDELYEYEEKVKKNPNAKMSDSELQKIHMLSDTVKNFDKIEMLEGSGYSEEGGSSYARGGRGGGSRGGQGGNQGGSRGGQGGGYSRDGGEWMAQGGYGDGNSYEGGSSYARRKRDSMGRYSRDDGKEEMTEKLREMMREAEGEEREAIRRCLRDIENA